MKRNYFSTGCSSSKVSVLDVQLQKEALLDAAKIKLLLLGAGESGKSTIFKQMKVRRAVSPLIPNRQCNESGTLGLFFLQILYGKPPSETERMELKPAIHCNVVDTMRVVVEESQKMGNSVVCLDELAHFNAMEDSKELTPADGLAIASLWRDPGIGETWERRAEYQVVESIRTFFNDIERISGDGYIPTEQDMLQSRVRTSGIITETYEIDSKIFEMYDVGGQRNERKKWIHCFENVTAVIFVAALSEYNQKLFEDTATNRMIEALDLFEEICSSPFFKNTSMLLFLNKKDLFEEKVKKVPINDTPQFADYTGGPDYDKGVAYFVNQFKSRFKEKGSDGELHHHCTCATDTKNVEVVFGVCKSVILQNLMKETGFM